MSGTAGRRGFTLLELLLTLAIFSVVLLLLLSSFTGVERAREILSDRYRDFRQLRMSIDRLGADIQGAFSSDGIEATALTCHEDTFSETPAATLIFTPFARPGSKGPPGGRKKSALPGKVAFVLTSSPGEESRRVVPLPLSGTEAAVPFSGRRTEARP